MFLKFLELAKCKVLIFICLIINQSIFSEGFIAQTLVKTQDGYKQIADLKENDFVISYSFKDKVLVNDKVTKIKKLHYKTCFKLTIAEEDILTAPDHKFFCPLSENSSWIKAKYLKSGDFISSNLTECIRIDNIEELNQEADFYCLTIDKYHNYFVSEQNIFVHNFVWVIPLGAIGGSEVVASISAFAIMGLAKLSLDKLFGGSYAKPCGNDPYYFSNKRIIDAASIGTGVVGGTLLYDNLKNKEENLPINIGDFPFVPPKTKEGTIPKNKTGGFIDKSGNAWNWDPKKGEWDVVDKRGKGHRNVNPGGKETHPGTHPDAKSGTSKSKR